MKHRQIMIISAAAATLAALLLSCSSSSPGSTVRRGVGMAETPAAEGASAVLVAPSPGREKTGTPKIEDRLVQIVAAYRAGDSAKLAALGSERDVDLSTGSAHVILEMDINPEAHTEGAPTIETVTLADGRVVQIQHGPAVFIRPDLAQAIAATGATYETAYENNVQVLAPFASLDALARIPGVRYMRLPYPTEK